MICTDGGFTVTLHVHRYKVDGFLSSHQEHSQIVFICSEDLYHFSLQDWRDCIPSLKHPQRSDKLLVSQKKNWCCSGLLSHIDVQKGTRQLEILYEQAHIRPSPTITGCNLWMTINTVINVEIR